MINELQYGLYIVATPIGNLGDLSPRAAEILRQADIIAVEDSRVTAKLLNHIGAKVRMVPYHDHSNDRDRAMLVEMMREKIVVLVSDAGTPLISDPGYKLVRDARAGGIEVFTIPGPSAVIAALTLSGLPTDRFLFEGFLPSKAKARADVIAELSGMKATLVFYESGPRLGKMLAGLREGLGNRDASVSREISKKFEQTVCGTLDELAARYAEETPKGEIVVVVGPPIKEDVVVSDADIDAALIDALGDMSASKAAGEVSRAFGLDRKELYTRAVKLKQANSRE